MYKQICWSISSKLYLLAKLATLFLQFILDQKRKRKRNKDIWTSYKLKISKQLKSETPWAAWWYFYIIHVIKNKKFVSTWLLHDCQQVVQWFYQETTNCLSWFETLTRSFNIISSAIDNSWINYHMCMHESICK